MEFCHILLIIHTIIQKYQDTLINYIKSIYEFYQIPKLINDCKLLQIVNLLLYTTNFYN